MKHKLLFIMVFGLLVAGFAPAILFAQSAAVMDTILDQDALTFGAASYLMMAARGDIDENTGFDRAAEMMADTQPSFSGMGPEDTLNLGEYSYLLMKVYEVSGGLMYRILPGPRYAVRELAYIDVVQGGSYPKSVLTGERAVRILERYLTVSHSGKAGGDV